MANVGDILTAAFYNSMKSRVVNTVSTGSGDKGYGQSIGTWADATTADVSTAAKWIEMRNYINVARKHQLGNSVGYTEAELPTPVAGTTLINAVLANAYEAKANEVYTQSLTYGVSSMTLTANAFSNTRSSPWTGTIDAEIDVTWPSANEARWFFNSGGEIRIVTSHPAGTANNNSWSNALNRVGTVAMKAHSTTRTGDNGTPAANIGYYELPTDPANYAIILDGENFDPTYAGIPSYQYMDDFYIRAKRIPNGIRFLVQLIEQNGATMTSGTEIRFSHLKATTYLTNPAIITPTFGLYNGNGL